jgi:hypothetical protein
MGGPFLFESWAGAVNDWSLTGHKGKPIKIGAKVTSGRSQLLRVVQLHFRNTKCDVQACLAFNAQRLQCDLIV